MGFQWVDFLILISYLVVITLIGSLAGGRQRNVRDYFLGGGKVPWWAVSFSIVAAETSTLTFISIPGLAYIGNLNFLQVSFGYLLGRIVVAYIFLPSYKAGKIATAYEFLENRFGQRARKFASVIFLLTRIAADGVRLFATAIPLAIIFKGFSLFAGFSNVQIYIVSILIIALVALLYTFIGGIKGVIWVDVIQMTIYIGGALLALFILLSIVPGGFRAVSNFSGGVNKFSVVNFSFRGGIKGFFSEPYHFLGSLLGGMFLSMASHGTDQLIVQRLLSTRSIRDSQKAVITSGVIVNFQFALFLLVGLMLFAFYRGAQIGQAGIPFTKADEIFPYFIVYSLPVGVKGLIIAGLFAAAISTLAGSISSLSSSAIMDLYRGKRGYKLDERKELVVSRVATFVSAVILMFVAFGFIRVLQSVVEIALGIASITYGGLLGTFILGTLFRRVDEKSALAGFVSGIVCMGLIIVVPFVFGKPPLFHWTWYTFIGCFVTVVVGNLAANVKRLI